MPPVQVPPVPLVVAEVPPVPVEDIGSQMDDIECNSSDVDENKTDINLFFTLIDCDLHEWALVTLSTVLYFVGFVVMC